MSLSQLKQINKFPFSSFKTHYNIILLRSLGLPFGLFPCVNNGNK
jgi:hypothetical protein